MFHGGKLPFWGALWQILTRNAIFTRLFFMHTGSANERPDKERTQTEQALTAIPLLINSKQAESYLKINFFDRGLYLQH